MKKSIKRSKSIIIVLLLIFITYFGGNNKFIREHISYLGERFIEQIWDTPNESKDTENKLIGKIIRVSDGDTVVLKDNNGKKHKIRLNGIDCPEIGQEYGDEASKFVNNLALNKYASVEVVGVDQYKRILGILYVDDVNVNEELLKNGLAWIYKFNNDIKYKNLMQEAKEKKINIWSKANSIDPYVWRKKNKSH